MIYLHLISPDNEAAVVRGLADEIRTLWPDIAASEVDRIDLIVGARFVTSIDLIIVIDLHESKAIGRGGEAVRCGIIAVELKQLSSERFENVGNQLVARYEKLEERTVVDQARKGAYAVKKFGSSIGAPGVYVYALAWLSQVDQSKLDKLDPAMVGRQGGWLGLLRAALAQSAVITHADLENRERICKIRDRLVARKTLSPLGRKKAEKIARNAALATIVHDLSPLAGKKLIRVAGHGGSGKTTALTLLASRLAIGHGARVLILSFHQALCTDIRSTLEAMPETRPLVGSSICVMTASSFLLRLLEVVGEVPKRPDGVVDYDRMSQACRLAVEGLGGADIFAIVTADNRSELKWDHILIDEAQDWLDEERDLLRVVYGSSRLVLMDGLAQLVRRQIPCNWLANVPKAECEIRFLTASLRMAHNVALFTNAFAETIGLGDWRVEPTPELSGGRIVVVTGSIENRLPIAFAVAAATEAAGARPVDLLLCVPPTEVTIRRDGSRQSLVGAELLDVGLQVWDASDSGTRAIPPASHDAWRIVTYDSCRGLEGYAALLFALDDIYANKIKHPNDLVGDAVVDPELVARRFLLIPMTRAVQLLVINVRDPDSPLAELLREATSLMPEGVVEWCTADEAPSRIAPATANDV